MHRSDIILVQDSIELLTSAALLTSKQTAGIFGIFHKYLMLICQLSNTNPSLALHNAYFPELTD